MGLNFSGVFNILKEEVHSGYTNYWQVPVYIKKVLYRNPATIVFWSDNTKTVSKCAAEDTYSKEAGLSICIAKKLTSSTAMRNVFDEWVSENDSITLKEVRYNKKQC